MNSLGTLQTWLLHPFTSSHDFPTSLNHLTHVHPHTFLIPHLTPTVSAVQYHTVHLHQLRVRFSMLCRTFGFRPIESKPELVPTCIFLLPHSCQPVNSLPLLVGLAILCVII